MANRRKNSSKTSLNMPKAKRARVEFDFFRINDLPPELLLYVFKYLDLNSWKVARRVSEQWNQFLCDASKFPVEIKNCRISRRSPPFSTFRRTKSFFPLVVIHQNVSWDTDEELLEFLEFIGKDTLHLRILWDANDMKKLKPPKNLLMKFPKLQTIECSVEFLLDDQIPSTVSQFKFWGMKNFMNPNEVQKVQALLQNKPTKVSVNSIEIVKKPQKSDLEFIKVDNTLLQIANDTEAKNIEIKIMNLRENQSVELSDVIQLGELDESWFINGSNKECFVQNLQKMKSLTGVYVEMQELESTYCFFHHTPLESLSVKKLVVSSIPECRECFVSLLKSFPNLEEFSSSNSILDLGTVLENTGNKLKIIKILDTTVDIEEFIQLPNEVCSKLSNLTHLILDEIRAHWDGYDDDDLSSAFIRKFPKMPKLVQLDLTIDVNEGDLKKFYKLFKLCPNVVFFGFECFKNFNLTDLVKVLKLWPQLEELQLRFFSETQTDSKTFIDAIAPHAKNLVKLDFEDVFYNNGQAKSLYMPEKKYHKYLMKKIPSLRNIQS